MSEPTSTGEGGALSRAELLARFVPGCDPLNSTDLAQIGRQLEDLRISLRGEGAELEDSLCGMAERILELLDRHGHIGGRQALDLILEIVEQVHTAVGGDLGEEGSELPEPTEEEPGDALGRVTLGLRLMDQRRLGEILVSLSMLSKDQVERALRHQRATGRRFGEVLVDLGYLSQAAVDSALRIQNRRLMGGIVDPWMRRA